MTARDDDDPRLTQALALWAEAAVPVLPDDFTARVMADVVAAQAMTAWADEAVPELADDFTARVMADAAVGRAVSAWEESVPALPDDFAAMVATKAAARLLARAARLRSAAREEFFGKVPEHARMAMLARRAGLGG